MLQAKRLYAQRVVAAGNKFDNHKFNYGSCGVVGRHHTIDSRIDYTNLEIVCATEKCSGTLICLGVDPTRAGIFVARTKNGCEERYLFTFQEVIKKQFGDDLMVALWNYLDQTGCALNAELVTSQIVSPCRKAESCCHGYRPLTDHVIIHGGTKKNQDPLNLTDLYQMRNTIARDWGKEVIRGMWFPHATYFITKNGYDDLLLLEKAFIEVNNRVLCPKIRKVAPCSLDDAVAAPSLEVDNYHYWSTGFRAEACKRGIPSCRVFDHFTSQVDNGNNLEGWVMHYVSSEMLGPGGSYELLGLCLDKEKPMFYEARIPALEDVSSGFRWNSGAEKTEILMGFVPLEEGTKNRKLTIDEMLARYAAGPVLTNFLWGLLDFVESEEGVMCGMAKNSFLIQLDTLKDSPGETVVMTVTMRGEMQWYLYERYYRKILHNTQVVKFCRGFSMLLTTNEEEAMDVMDCGGGGKMQENRDKWKLINYTLQTMAIRPFYDKLECLAACDAGGKRDSKKASLISWDERFGQFFDLGFFTRWGAVHSTSRYEALKYMYLVAAYCSSRTKNPEETFLDMIDNMMKTLETPNSRRVMCVDWLLLYADVRGSAVTPSKTACSMLEALANGDGDALMEMAVLALEDPSNVLLAALVKDIELGLGILNRVADKSVGGGFMYAHLLNNQKINGIKSKFFPLLLLTCKYNVDFIYKNSKPVETLKIVLVAGTPGMGKTTYLKEVAKNINERYERLVVKDFSKLMRCLVMGADTFSGSSRKEQYAALFSETAGCMDSDPDINMLLLDRCCASDFKAIRMLLRTAFPNKLLDIHLLIPSHGITVVQGNEKDWFFPFSLEQIAVNSCSAFVRKHNGGLMPSANAVEGAHGFDVAIKHVVGARTNMDIEAVAREEFRCLSGNFRVSYFKYVSGEVAIPGSIMVAVVLSMGLQLSKETKQSIEKNSVEKGCLVSDGLIFKTLALCLRDSYGHCVEALETLLSDIFAVESCDNFDVIVDRVWPEWLNKWIKEDAAKYLSAARLPTNVTVAEMTNAILHGTAASAPASDKNLVERLHIPFIPQYFGIQVTAASTAVKDFLAAKFMQDVKNGPNFYCRRGDIHVTTMVPTMLSAEAADGDGCLVGGILRHHINCALNFEPFKFRVETIVAGPTTNAALVTITSDNYCSLSAVCKEATTTTHMTLMCSGPNKDSIHQERIQYRVDCEPLEVEGNYVGKMRAPTLFGLY
jgi:hypothetical protein